jgi:hypothetical protein
MKKRGLEYSSAVQYLASMCKAQYLKNKKKKK